MNSQVKKTLLNDLGRSAIEGVNQAGYSGLYLLILIEVFLKPSGLQGELAQSWVFGSGFLGMVLSLFYVQWTSHAQFSKKWLIVFPTLASCALFLFTQFSVTAWSFAILVGLGNALLPVRIPYLTEIYHENFPTRKRGQYHGYGLIAGQVFAVGFAYFCGVWLDYDLESWRWILLITAVAIGLAAYFSSQIPAQPPRPRPTRNPLSAFKVLKTDKLFAYILLVWFIFGFANLWIFPIRVSYLAEFRDLDPATVTLLVSVVPEATRMLFLPVWAYLFDRMNFIVLRMLLNVFFVLGIFGFFFSESLLGIGVSAFLHGVGFSGGRLAWGLWITKMVPQEKTSEYMSVHVSLTGFRGLFGPMLGFYVLSQLPSGQSGYETLALMSSSMFLLSILMLAPIIKYGNDSGRQTESSEA